ncbi:MAG: hypothetical protein LBE55_02820 [Clostridiales bacterium]|jgi:hypothetical protein|nr:hypothetical protein [Clostridiales bacterium]
MADFFNKIAGGINKGVATVSANTKAMADKSKIKAVISNLENERRQLIQMLGQKIYDMHTETGEISVDEHVSNFISEITRRLELMAAQQEEMMRVDAELNMITGGTRHAAPYATPYDGIQCTCGHFNPAGARFCAGCGSNIGQPTPPGPTEPPGPPAE